MSGIICVDFDRTISPVGFPNPLTEPPHPDCIKVLTEFKNRGYEIWIFSCRSNPDILGYKESKRAEQEMSDYLVKHNIPHDSFFSEKPDYSLLIDDKAGFNGDWSQFLKLFQ